MPVIAYHIILTGYGHWPPNDPRGSLSTGFRKPSLREAGEIHYGRKRQQPPRGELRAFHRQIRPMLQHPVIWLDDAKRQAVGGAFGQVITTRGYTCYACVVMSNHAHLLIRRHRDKAEEMIAHFWQASSAALRALSDVPNDHPIWARDPYKRYKSTPEQVWEAIEYIEDNPLEAGEAPQHWPFVKPYDNWPLHKQPR